MLAKVSKLELIDFVAQDKTFGFIFLELSIIFIICQTITHAHAFFALFRRKPVHFRNKAKKMVIKSASV